MQGVRQDGLVALEIIVERLPVAGYRTTDTGSMGREQRRYLRTMILQVEDRERCLPFVGVSAEIRFGLFAFRF